MTLAEGVAFAEAPLALGLAAVASVVEVAEGEAAAVLATVAFAAAFLLVAIRVVGAPVGVPTGLVTTVVVVVSGGGVGGLLSNCPVPLQMMQPQFRLLCSLSATNHMR